MAEFIARSRKAVGAGIAVGVSTFWTLAGGGITAEEAGAIASAVVVAAAGVWFIPNKPTA